MNRKVCVCVCVCVCVQGKACAIWRGVRRARRAGIRLQLRKIPETLRMAGTIRQVQATSAVSGVYSSTCPQIPHPKTDNSAPAHYAPTCELPGSRSGALHVSVILPLKRHHTHAPSNTASNTTIMQPSVLLFPAVRVACPAHLPN